MVAAERQLLGLVEAQRALASRLDELRGAQRPAGAAVGASGSGLPVKRPRTEEKQDGEANIIVAAAPADDTLVGDAPPRRLGLRRSAAFGAMQGFLSAAVRESAGHHDVLRQRDAAIREANIARVTAEAAELARQISLSEGRLQEAREALSQGDLGWLKVNELLARIEAEEALYCSAFFLQAAGADAGAAHQPFHIFFSPAVHTPETSDIVTSQIEQALDQYLPYRQSVDAMLAALEEEEAMAGSGRDGDGGADEQQKKHREEGSHHAREGSSLLEPPPLPSTLSEWVPGGSAAAGVLKAPPLAPDEPNSTEGVASSGDAPAAAPQAAGGVAVAVERPYTELDDFED
jgi:hypothetical protein